MPGLVGVISHERVADAAATEVLAGMIAAVSHFDDYVVTDSRFDGNRIVLGNVSLPLTDRPSQEYSEGDVTVILDGEISNAEELGAASGHGLAGDNGAELVCRMYGSSRDTSFLRELTGWFNVVLYDGRKDTLLLANDMYGIRPLYYHDSDGRLVFAAEVKAILKALPQKPALDHQGIADYFVFDGPLNERTLFNGINRFPPASAWTWQDGSWRKDTYWSPQEYADIEKCPADKAFETAEAVFRTVMKRYAKGTYLLSLTGGNDTRVMMSLMEAHQEPRSSFTYGITARSADVILARRVAGAMGLPHEFIAIDDSFLRQYPEYAERSIWLSDGMGDIASASILHIHDRHRNCICAGGKYGTQVSRGVRQKVWEMSRLPNLGVFSKDFFAEVEGLPRESLAAAREKFAGFANESDADLMFTIIEECRHHWGGKLAMENAMILVRTPFTDKDVVELTLRLPPGMAMDHRLQHFVIRKNSDVLGSIPTNRGLIVDSSDRRMVLWARFFKLWFFLSTVANSGRVPPFLRLDRTFLSNNATAKYRSWLRAELRDYVHEMVLDRKTLSREFFDENVLRSMVRDHVERKKDYWYEIVKVISFELFLRQFVDR